MVLKPFLSTQKGFRTLQPIDKKYPQPPFMFGLVGPSRSGKSVLCRSLLKEVYAKAFDYIFLFSQSYDVNSDYDEFEKIQGTNSFDQEEIREIMNDQREIVKQAKRDNEMNVVPSVLIILDDVIDDPKFCRSSCLSTLAIRGRHTNISVMILAQKLSGIPRTVRLNMSHMCVFRSLSGNEVEFILNETTPRYLRKKMFEKQREIYAEPYTFLYFNNIATYQKDRIKIGFETPLDICF